MRAILCRDWGGPDALEFSEVPSPAMQPGHVHVRVRAAGINFADTLMVSGKYQVKPPLPFIPGLEIAGEILAVAPDVTTLKPGQRVLAFFPGRLHSQAAIFSRRAILHA